ncbi:hypothetical protein, partial [Citrobacter freundii]|uniref:hypothetical protein n=1 Tax=Citrobacter freundii TaxID=546 RepID=UPI0033465E2C
KTLEKPLYTNHSEYSQYQEYFALLVGDSAQIMKKRVFTQPERGTDVALAEFQYTSDMILLITVII